MKEKVYFQCDHCSKILRIKRRMKKHEEECLKNPKNRSCFSCVFNNIKHRICLKKSLILLPKKDYRKDINLYDVDYYFKNFADANCENPTYENCKNCKEFCEDEFGHRYYCELKEIAESLVTIRIEDESYLRAKRFADTNNTCYKGYNA